MKKSSDFSLDGAWKQRVDEWQKRDWLKWLGENLTFPFEAERIDDDDAYFTDVADREPFRLGHTMKVIGLEMEDDLYGVIAKVREKRRVGAVPLGDLRVISKRSRNTELLEEYLEWFAYMATYGPPNKSLPDGWTCR